MQPKHLTASAGGSKYLKRQKTQNQSLSSANLFRRVWVGSSRTLEPVSSETTKWKLNSIQNFLLKKHVSFGANTSSIQKLIYGSESSKSNCIRLGKMSIALLYYSVVPCMVTRIGYAGASSQWLPGLSASFQAPGNFKPFTL